MISIKDREMERIRALFAGISVEPIISYSRIIDAVRKTRPPESVWGTARDIATHLACEPSSTFSPDQVIAIRRGMADRWVHSAFGSGEQRSKREQVVIAVWERMHFAGIPPIRYEPLMHFCRRHEEYGANIFPLQVDRSAKIRMMK